MLTATLASADTSDGGGAALVVLLGVFALAILVIAGWWKVFVKAGEAGWKAIIPIYNTIVLLRIAGKPWWWILLLLIPLVNLVLVIIWYVDLARSFGKGAGFAVGMVFLPFVFILILGFGGAKYLGPAGVEPQPPRPAG